MRIAVLGSRGVPAAYSGIERHVEEVGARIAAVGHQVVVYCHGRGTLAEHRGMQLRYLPTLHTKHLETATHMSLAGLSVLRGFDVVHIHAVGPALFAPLPRYLSRAGVVETVHGLDSQRAKWGPTGRTVLRVGEWASARFPDVTTVVSRTLQRHYLQRYGVQTELIYNGALAPPTSTDPAATLRKFGLEADRYALFVGRLVPEKAPHVLIEAFRRVSGDVRLAVVGGTAHTTGYVRVLERWAADDPRIVLTGPQYGATLGDLYRHAAVFASPSTVEGAPVTLLEAVVHGVPVIVSDIPEHLEDIDEDQPGWRVVPVTDVDALAASLERVFADVSAERAGIEKLSQQLLEAHDWDRAAERTLSIYERVARR